MQIIGCMSPPSTVGRNPLSTRFTALVRVACMSYPALDSLLIVYTNIIEKVRQMCLSVPSLHMEAVCLHCHNSTKPFSLALP